MIFTACGMLCFGLARMKRKQDGFGRHDPQPQDPGGESGRQEERLVLRLFKHMFAGFEVTLCVLLAR